MVGNVDAGKSTLLGVITHGELDNGRGFARQKLFRHKHEMESGRTSSVGNDILGFDARGNVVNQPEHGHLDWIKICERASKVDKWTLVASQCHNFFNLSLYHTTPCHATLCITLYIVCVDQWRGWGCCCC